ncbi:hypothetical protein Dimus_001219, partial [Dionaea muscipula]
LPECLRNNNDLLRNRAKSLNSLDHMLMRAVATFCDHPRTDVLFDSFMEHEKDVLVVRRMRELNYLIRVSEEQAVFICSSDFSCGCICHGREEEQSSKRSLDKEDNNMAGGGFGGSSKDGGINGMKGRFNGDSSAGRNGDSLMINEASYVERLVGREFIQPQLTLHEEELRGFGFPETSGVIIASEKRTVNLEFSSNSMSSAVTSGIRPLPDELALIDVNQEVQPMEQDYSRDLDRPSFNSEGI